MNITVVEVNRLSTVPPVINLLYNLVSNNNNVIFIGYKKNDLPEKILQSSNFIFEELDSSYDKYEGKTIRYIKRLQLAIQVRELVRESMFSSELLWITSYNSVKLLGKEIFNYKYVLQLMELVYKGYLYKKVIQFPIDEYARRAYKVVVPEENRAYIEKAWWGLKDIPKVLPNKPYCIEEITYDDDLLKAIEVVRNENNKIILYLGGLWADRDLRPFAKSIKNIPNYRLYIVGKAFNKDAELQLEELINKYDVNYLGNFSPPKHLEFVRFVHIGFLSYKSISDDPIASLNALYCAPNKIFEYAAFGIPMIGNEILGLQIPFSKYGIGVCCNEADEDDVRRKIIMIEDNYSLMKKKCEFFYNSISLDDIVQDILS